MITDAIKARRIVMNFMIFLTSNKKADESGVIGRLDQPLFGQAVVPGCREARNSPAAPTYSEPGVAWMQPF
jgi:hypothetical protein